MFSNDFIRKQVETLINKCPSSATIYNSVSDGYGGTKEEAKTDKTIKGLFSVKQVRKRSLTDNGASKIVNEVSFITLINKDSKVMDHNSILEINNNKYSILQIIDVDKLGVYYEVVLNEK